MNTSTIVHQLPGQQVPEAYLKIVRTKCPTVFGFAGQLEDGTLAIEQSDSTPTLEELKELTKSFKTGHLVMYFGNQPKSVVPDDIQPFTLNDGAEDPRHFLALFFEGDFSKYDGLNGDHSEEYCVSDEVVFPKLERAFNEVDKDLPKFMDKIKDKSFQRALSATYNTRGTFVFMGETDEPIVFGTNAIGGSYPWGHTSNAFDYSEKPAVVEQVKQAATAGLSFLRGKKSTTSVSSGTTPVPEPKPDVPHPDADKDVKHVEVPKPAEEPKTKVVDGITFHKMGPPPKLFSHNKAWNTWLRTFNAGALPDDHQSKSCSVWVPVDLVDLAKREVSTKDDVVHLAGEVHGLRKAKNAALKPVDNSAVAAAEAEAARELLVGKGEKPITTGKPEMQKPPSRSTTREKVPSAADFLPVMTDEERDRSMNLAAGFLAKQKRPGYLEIQKMESKHKTYSESIGVKQDELFFFTISELKELLGDAGAMAFIEMKNIAIQKGGIKLEDLVSGTTKVEETKVEAKSTTPAKSGNRLSFLRGKSAA